MSQAKASRLNQGSNVLTYFFIAEFVLKLLGLGPWGYFGGSDGGMNTFDFLIVAMSLVDIVTQVGALSLLVGMSEGYSQALDNGNMGLTILFAVECLLKLTGLGIYGYASDPWNYLDFACVVTGMVELVLVVGVMAAVMAG